MVHGLKKILNRSTHHLQKLGVRTEIKKESGGRLYNFQSSCSAYRKRDLLKEKGDLIYLFLVDYMTLSSVHII
jgi:hypothetical protein